LGKSTGKTLLSIAGLAFGFGGAFGIATKGIQGALMGLSLATTVWSALHPAKTDYNFDSTVNKIDNDAMIPIVYGTRKWGGIQTWAFTASDGKKQQKDIIISEGPIAGISGVSANCLLVGNGTGTVASNYGAIGEMLRALFEASRGQNTLFTLQNVVYSDATMRIYQTNHPTGNDKVLELHANGITTSIALQHVSDIAVDKSNDFSCSTLKLMQHIEELGTGWLVMNNAGVDANPETIIDIGTVNAYKNPTNVCGVGTDGCSYAFANGTLPDNYETVGSYKNCAWVRANFTINETLQGTNPTISMIVKGMLVYDPRTGLTAYSENPALCLRDYVLSKRYGMGRWIKSTDLDDDSWIEVADYCDALITYIDAYGNTVTEPRYRLNIILAEKQKNMANVQAILAVFAGFLVISGEKLILRVEKQESISYSFDETNIKAGSVKFEQTDLESSPNRYSIIYNDPAQNFVGVKVQVEDSADQHQRGNIINKDVTLQGCIHQGQALRLGRIFKALNRLNPNIVTFSTGTMALHLQPGDITNFTYGVLSKMPMRILQTSEVQGVWTIKAQQYTSSIYDDALGAQISVGKYVQIQNAFADVVANVINMDIIEQFRELGNGVVVSDAEVTWTSFDTFYREADVYVLSDNPTWDEIDVSMNDLEGTWASIGNNSGAWKFAGKGNDRLFLTNLVKGLTYTFKIVSVNTVGRKANFDQAPVISVTIKGKTYTPAPPTGLSVTITDKCEWHWNILDLDCDFAELRTNTNPGSTTGLLAKTSSTKVIITPPLRAGTVYLYAHNTAKYYSDPCVLKYSKAAPDAPIGTVITDIFQGFTVNCAALPTYCIGINVHVDANEFFTPNASYTFKALSGIFDVSCAYVDVFGEGTRTIVVRKVIDPTIDPALIAAESLSLDKMDTVITDAVAQAQNSVDAATYTKAITQVVTDLHSANTVIAQNSDDIQLRATSADLISLINVCPEVITIKSDLIHIQGDTLIDDDVIVGGMIKVRSIDGDRIIAKSITSNEIAANAITIGNFDPATASLMTTSSSGRNYAIGTIQSKIANPGWNLAYVLSPVTPLDATFTISFDYIATVANGAGLAFGTAEAHGGVFFDQPNLIGTTLNHHIFTGVCSRLVTDVGIWLYVNDTTTISKFKLEGGANATGWTLATEEIDSSIALAQTTANTAVANALTANNMLADIGADDKLTAVEKKSLKRIWDAIVSEMTMLDSQAWDFGLTAEKGVYDNAYGLLNAYITPLLVNLDWTSDVVGVTLRSTFKTYYDAKISLINAISTNAKDTANIGIANALIANNLLLDIANDDKLTPIEKSSIKKEWDTIVSEFPQNNDQAWNFGVTTEKYAYDIAYDALNSYIAPLIATLNTTNDIVGATFRNNFKAYYDARTGLLNAVATVALSTANIGVTNAGNAQTSANAAIANALSAQDTANTAIANALIANNLLADIANDNKLTPIEKSTITKEWDTIVSEQGLINDQAWNFQVLAQKATFDNAYASLSAYVTPLIADLGTTNDIIGTTFRSAFKVYYDARTDLLNMIAVNAKTTATNAQTTADAAVANALTAQNTANTAIANALTANNMISDIGADNKLTAGEKKSLKKEWDVIVSEQNLINDQAWNLGITTQKYTFDNAYDSLNAYVTPLLVNLDWTTDIVGTTLRSAFKVYYDARTDLLNTIAYNNHVTANTGVANASAAQHTADTTLDITNNNRALSAGSVYLDATGMKLSEASGAYTKFDADGINWFSTSGVKYASVRRMCQGSVANGKYVRLNWDKLPFIILSPLRVQTMATGYTNADVQVICQPYQVTPSGFRVQLLTNVLNGSTADNTSHAFNTTLTTPSTTTSFTVSFNSNGWNSSSLSHYSTHVNYRLVGSTTWILLGNDNSPQFGNNWSYSRTYSASGLDAGTYEILGTIDGNGGYSASFNNLSCTGGGTINSTGVVNFLAMESDGNSFYTVED